jgi:hypothetical protein
MKSTEFVQVPLAQKQNEIMQVQLIKENSDKSNRLHTNDINEMEDKV